MRRITFVICCLAVVAPVGVSSFIHAQEPENKILPTDARIRTAGRFDASLPGKLRFAYPGSGMRLRFHGTGMRLAVSADSEKSALTVLIDHGEPSLLLLKPGENDLTVASNLEEGDHLVEIIKRTETWQGILTVEGLTLTGAGKLLDPPAAPARRLLFLGDSVTCGTGVNNNATCTNDLQHPSSDAWNSYGLLLGRRLDAETHLVCYGGRGVVRDYRGLNESDGVLNAPQFLHLAIPTDARDGRVSWEAKNFQPDGIFISLGTNDMNLEKSKPLDEKTWVAAYVELLRSVRADYPQAQIFLTDGAIVTDPLLRRMIEAAAAQFNDARVQVVAGVHHPGSGCNGHPTRAQHEQMSQEIEPVLRKALGW
jgi:lysophospholipase L1-like esterase